MDKKKSSQDAVRKSREKKKKMIEEKQLEKDKLRWSDPNCGVAPHPPLPPHSVATLAKAAVRLSALIGATTSCWRLAIAILTALRP